MDLKLYTLVSNRGPNFTTNGKRHSAAGGTQDVYPLICDKLAKRWICIAPGNAETENPISDSRELDVLFVKEEIYAQYYYKFVAEYLYPNILGSYGVLSAARARREFDLVSESVARKIGNDHPVILCDYHLYNVPKFLNKDKEIHFFWFLPFLKATRTNDVYFDILEGLMNVSTLWFLHEDYKNNFLNLAESYYGYREFPKVKTLVLGPSNFYKQEGGEDISDFISILDEKFNITYDAGCIYLLTVARMDFVKKIPLLLKALKMIEHKLSSVKLMILAPHHRRESKFYQQEELRVYDLVNELHTDELVYISHDNLTKKQLKILYKYADLFILPSTFDAMPLTPLEYVLSNKGDGAVLTSDSSGTSKILSNSTYVFKHDNTQSLAMKIIEAIESSRYQRVAFMKKNKEIVSDITSDFWIERVTMILESINHRALH